MRYSSGGNTGFDIIIAVIAFPVWFAKAIVIKMRSGKPIRTILRERPQLFEDSLGIAFILLLLGFAIFMYINNR